MTLHPDDPLFSVAAPRARSRPVGAVIAIVLLIAFLAACYLVLPREAPWLLQKLLGLVCAGLVLWAVLEVSRPRETSEELLYRLRRGQHSDFGKQLLLNRPKPKTIKLPLVGTVMLRTAVAAAISLAALLWWFTPLAPVHVRRATIADLTIAFGEEIAAAVLVMPNGSMAMSQPPLIPAGAQEEARRIGEADGAYKLGLKAIAEGRFDEARLWLRTAEKEEEVEAGQALLAQAQNEAFAGRFHAAAALYEASLQSESNHARPLVLCQAAVAWFHAGDFTKSASLLARAQKATNEKDPERVAVMHVQALLALAQGKDYARAQELCRLTREAIPEDDRETSPFFPASLNNQAAVGMLRGGFFGAEELFKAAYDRWSQGTKKQHPLPAAALGNLGVLDLVMGRPAEAGPRLHEAIALRGDSGATQPLGRAAALTAAVMYHVAVYDYDEAQQDAKAALLLIEKELGLEQRGVVAVLLAFGRLRYIESRYVQANAHLMHALGVAKESWAEQHPNVAAVLIALAEADLEQGRVQEAEDFARQAQEIYQNAFGAQHIGVAQAEAIRGQVALGQDRPRDARPFLERSLKIQREAFGREHPAVAETMGHLAALDTSSATYPHGVDQYEKAIRMAQATLGQQHPLTARLLYGLARLHVAREKFPEAEKALREALLIQEKALTPYHPALAATLELYADVLSRLDPRNAEKAASLRTRAQAVRAKHQEEDRPA